MGGARIQDRKEARLESAAVKGLKMFISLATSFLLHIKIALLILHTHHEGVKKPKYLYYNR